MALRLRQLVVSELSFLLSNSELKGYSIQNRHPALQCVTRKHMGYKDDKTAQVRIKQLSLLDRGLEKQQFWVPYAEDEFFPITFRTQQINPLPPSSLSVIQALNLFSHHFMLWAEKCRDGNPFVQLYQECSEVQCSNWSMQFILNRKQKNSQAEVVSNTPKRPPELSTLMAS